MNYFALMQILQTVDFAMMLYVACKLFRFHVRLHHTIPLLLYGIVCSFIQHLAYNDQKLFIYILPVILFIGLLLIMANTDIPWPYALLMAVVSFIIYGVCAIMTGLIHMAVYRHTNFKIVFEAHDHGSFILFGSFLFMLGFAFVLHYFNLGIMIKETKFLSSAGAFFIIIVLYTVIVGGRLLYRGRDIHHPAVWFGAAIIDLALVVAYLFDKNRDQYK